MSQLIGCCPQPQLVGAAILVWCDVSHVYRQTALRLGGTTFIEEILILHFSTSYERLTVNFGVISWG